MYHFKIVPIDCPDDAVSVTSEDTVSAFDIADQMRWTLADVIRDGTYVFSVCKLGRKAAFWAIFQRPENGL